MAATRSLAVSAIATASALIVVVVCAIWILFLGAHDWGAILPMTIFLWFAHPLALLGFLLAAVNARPPDTRSRAIGLMIANLLGIALPWLAIGFVT